ncbi:MAG: UDP-glucose 4-epimerase GalE [Tissierellia bacterium]|nr:UDP-glucose 4-epimerase GalE [Tissierellia bacterium]
MKKVLVTGGIGYIGSHTVIELINAGFHPVIMDNLYNSKIDVLFRLEKICGKKLTFYEIDLREKEKTNEMFLKEHFDAVIHFAGLKAVGESVEKPLLYFDNNVHGTIKLLEVMEENQCKSIIFSSSATVYGDLNPVPFQEDMPTGVTNPYGRTKLMIEEMLEDMYAADENWRIVLLRYFNPVGAHESGFIGEDPRDIPQNLMPYIAKVASGELKELSIFGDDYNTPDGTAIRDYIHVVDLAKAHVKALGVALKEESFFEKINVGSSNGYSVMDMVKAFEKANDLTVDYQITPRRAGDIPEMRADIEKAKVILKWQPEKSLEDMCKDIWRWESRSRT